MSKPDSSEEIDKRVDRLLRNAEALNKFPTPIEDVIAAQRLSVSEPSQSPLAPGMIEQAPEALRNAIKSFGFKVLAMLDRRERMVHVDPEAPNTNHQRFNQMHEVGHDLCDWQNLTLQLDGRRQFSPDISELFEKEANYAGARLLFQGGKFLEIARTYDTGMASVVLLANLLGGSIHATFHQYVSTNLDSVAGYILHRSPRLDLNNDSLSFYVKQGFTSHQFSRRFSPLELPGSVISSSVHPDLQRTWDEIRLGKKTGSGELTLASLDGGFAKVPFELFSNTYNLFLLIKADRSPRFARSVRLVGATAASER